MQAVSASTGQETEARRSTASCNLHLGCGTVAMEGWLNCDQFPTEATDLVFDLEQSWPIQTSSQCQIYCSHTLEHLPHWDIFFQEAWRVLEPEGRLTLRVPYGGHPAAWWDFGHQRPWFIENFVFFQPGYAQQIGNMEHAGWQWPFDVLRIDVRLGGDIIRPLRWLPRWGRQVVMPYLRHLALAIEELFIYMTPLKTAQAVQRWQAVHVANVVPCNYVCYEHHWQGKQLTIGEPASLRMIGTGMQINGYV